MRITGFFCLLFSCWSIAAYCQETLRNYADEIGLNIGVCMGVQFDKNNQTHNDLVKREFNTVVAENSMKAASIHPSKGKTNFSGPDQLVSFALDNSMKIRGHTLVWHLQNAGWICTGSRQTSLENLKYHIDTVVGHFKGKVFQWDVVNEAFADDGSGGLRSSVWTSSIGDDFIDSAFVYAHAADPECKLFYNDYSISTINAKSTGVYTRVKKMLENGIPIHGVGFQSHQNATDANATFYSRIKENFRRFALLGIELAVTELDAKGSDFQAQADVYATYMRLALEIPAIKTYMIWGVRDQDSWVSPTPLIFDNSWQPKPAYTAILKLLKNPPEEDPLIVSILPGYCRTCSMLQRGGLVYYRANNRVAIDDALIGPTALEFFNLRGAKVAKATPGKNPPLLSTFYLPPGTAIARGGGKTVRVIGVR